MTGRGSLEITQGLLLSSCLDQPNSGPSRHPLDRVLEAPAQGGGRELGSGLDSNSSLRPESTISLLCDSRQFI